MGSVESKVLCFNPLELLVSTVYYLGLGGITTERILMKLNSYNIFRPPVSLRRDQKGNILDKKKPTTRKSKPGHRSRYSYQHNQIRIDSNKNP